MKGQKLERIDPAPHPAGTWRETLVGSHRHREDLFFDNGIRGLLGIALAIALCAPWTARAQTPEVTQISKLIRQGQLEAAEKRVQRLLARQPHSAKGLNLLGIIYLRESRYQDAEKALRQCVAEAPKFYDAWRNLGIVCDSQGKVDEARAAYEKVVKEVPGDPESNLALSALYYKSGQFDRSLDAANKIPSANRTLSLLPVLAADYLALNQPDKATLEIRAMLQVAEAHPELVPQLAEFMLERGATNDADELLQLAASRQKQTDRFLYAVARVAEQKGDRQKARQMLANVIDMSPDYLDALVAAGRLAGKDLDWNQAASLLERAAKLAPQRIDILQGRATAQLYGGKPKQGLETAKKLLELRPDDPTTWSLMSLALIGIGEWNAARPFAEKGLAARPEDRDANLVFAVVSYNLNKMDEAKKRIDFCLRQNGSDPGALFYLGLIQKTDGDSEGAIKTLTKSLAANPQNAEAQSTVGGLYLQSGDLEHAQEALEQAVQLAPLEMQNHYQLALVYKRVGLAQKAQEQLKIFQKLRAQHTAVSPAANEAPPPPLTQSPSARPR
jgi:tetratricopeptide (TPR) repeat protein